MSILIKGMEMPKNCRDCPLQEGSVDCRLTQKTYNWGLTERPSDCPLIPVSPHGRLIDADAAAKQGWTISRTYSTSPIEMVYEVKTMTDEVLPTIIPASFENLPKNARYLQDNPAEEGEI